MLTITAPTTSFNSARSAAWLPVIVIPSGSVILFANWPRWAFMWALAVGIYAGLKCLRFAGSSERDRSTVGRSLGFLLFWPGMDAERFLGPQVRCLRAARSEWIFAVGTTVAGIFTGFIAAPRLAHQSPLLGGWTGMIGIVLTLHFGLFHLLSLCWRSAGVDAPPIMRAPIRAASVSEFWGRRWNLAFRDLAHALVFQPLVGKCGVLGATIAVFLASGAVHELVVSIPAQGGFGLPTAYFAIQGLGLVAERSRFGRRIGLGRGLVGRLFAVFVIAAPLGLLFHRPFVERVVVPMLFSF